jgi:phage terminase small subunit
MAQLTRSRRRSRSLTPIPTQDLQLAAGRRPAATRIASITATTPSIRLRWFVFTGRTSPHRFSSFRQAARNNARKGNSRRVGVPNRNRERLQPSLCGVGRVTTRDEGAGGRLTPKQERFIAEYLKDLNATQAAIRAGYHPKMAAKLVAKSSIAAAIAERAKQQTEALGLTATEAREQNAFIATFDPAALFDEQRQLLHVKDMPRHVRCALKSVEVVKRNLTSGDGATDTTYKVQFWDKLKAIEMEYKHFGLLTDAIEHKGEIRIKWQE